ncbi:MAG: LysM peptidoglycan-binding domain-containing protein [Algoriphagus sp.]|jgi:LysM repeat protein|nr:LysM peptidoglycan-binding domain-containing protein [Algoriphagus sp.]MDP4747899.1 LysM peptidoglycan-binding domain-containing protein [Algoriphagus sp.]MDP4904379.1 LysM peptidoglycan-binding domain-containing protein [Algoriphagus sp.]
MSIRAVTLFCYIFFVILFSGKLHATELNRLDSIGVQKIGNQLFILHEVVEQESLFSISRRYKVPMMAIQQANEVLKQGIKSGQQILIPFGSNPATEAVLETSEPTKSPEPIIAAEVQEEELPKLIPSQKEEVVSTPNLTVPTQVETERKHQVRRGESLFLIAKKYKVTVAELKKWNSLSNDKVMVGQILKIRQLIATEKAAPAVAANSNQPTSSEIKKEEVSVVVAPSTSVKQSTSGTSDSNPSDSLAKAVPTKSEEWVIHQVKSGESLFSLSKEYGSSVGDLIEWNSLSSNNLKIGQSLKVSRIQASVATSESKLESQTESAVPVEIQENVEIENPVVNTSGGFSNTKENGLAELIPGTEANKKYLVLHRTAPVGSVVRVKNEENDRTIFARVVGVLPETGDNSKVLIKLSQAAYQQLKAVNARFPVEILY